jgi:Na+/proline symporter
LQSVILQASDAETVWVLRITIVAVGCVSCLIALVSPSVYALFTVCSDLVYVVLFPQLVAVIYIRMVNRYGVLAGYTAGLVCRLLVGESSLGFPSAIAVSQNVPIKTVCMLVNFAVTLLVSMAANWLILGRDHLRWDFLNAFERRKEDRKESIDWQEMWNSERVAKSASDRAHRRGSATIYAAPLPSSF